MLHRWLGILVFSAICLGAGAAGTPVAGDVSIAAVTAGINLSTSAGAHLTPKVAAHPRDLAQSVDTYRVHLTTFLLALLVTGAVLAKDDLPGARSVVRRLDRARRGPPALL
jgi:hypothetical protein